jgi:hypothetical protein
MRHADTDPELMDLVRRFVTPGRRYLRLGGSSLRLSGPERVAFASELVRAASEITPTELSTLFEGGWRERKTASWLVVVAGRTEFRSRIGDLLLASGGPYAGAAYCVTLATFGDSADAELLCRYAFAADGRLPGWLLRISAAHRYQIHIPPRTEGRPLSSVPTMWADSGPPLVSESSGMTKRFSPKCRARIRSGSSS